MDFFTIKEIVKKDRIDIYPDFESNDVKDLMVRGKAFYAIWDEENKIWSTNEFDVQRLVDAELWAYKDEHYDGARGSYVNVKTMKSYSSGSWRNYRKYISDLPDNAHQLDNKLTFANTKVKKSDYTSKRLPYNLEEGSIDAYDEIIGTLYSEKERQKIEWAIGSIVAGDSIKIQKFLVFFGEAGTGKSTILNIIQALFPGYYTMFDAKALGSSNGSFATEVFKTNPLVAIQHDGDLSKIEDNTKLNSIIAHEEMVVNEKYKSSYVARMNCFLFMGTNRPVKITDAKSGIIRRLIDVRPTGNRIPPERYFPLMEQVNYELGAIAYHCLQVYRKLGKNYYSAYRPTDMMLRTDVFYNYVENYYDELKQEDGITLRAAYEKYKQYCDATLVDFKLPMYKFREELKDYFDEFQERARIDGQQVRSYYKGFRWQKFNSFNEVAEEEKMSKAPSWLTLDSDTSTFDTDFADCPAQYSGENGAPKKKWINCTTLLRDIDTTKEHYVKGPENLIFVDFDLKNPDGTKSYEKNIQAASLWPPTYGELSKSGGGVHLYYIYSGDPTRLSRIYDEDIEIKTCTGNSAIRRRLTKCNNIPVATISSGLPFKKEKTMINFEAVKSERKMRELILRNMNKEIHPGTKPSCDFIFKIVEDAYNSGLHYDISDMKTSLFEFANNSTNHAQYCLELMSKMHYKSDDISDQPEFIEDKLVFYDVEVFPNLFLVNWKFAGEDQKVVRMINPTSVEIEKLLKFKLVGFNCRRYDNHMLYARLIGYSNEQMYKLSQKIILDHSSNAMFGEAYNISYTDIYDFCSKKQSLKKWEIELGIHHQELGLPWDKPVPEDKWEEVAEYCDNDVYATEALFYARKEDWVARQVLADIAGMSVNDTTNSLTTRIIFGKNKKPQSAFNYRFMGDESQIVNRVSFVVGKSGTKYNVNPDYAAFDKNGRPIFPGYTFKNGKSMYRGFEVGEGGFVLSNPGIWYYADTDDVESMHPTSAILEEIFGPEYTKRFKEIKDARIAIKHGDFETARSMLGGSLAKYLSDESAASDLAQALKIAINSVYGLTQAKFDNPFRDPRNIDNIVAKRGALFMINLYNEIKDKGSNVVHIKTDSVKVANGNTYILDFIEAYGKLYGYNFEHESTYEKMCLVNDAVFIAKYLKPSKCEKRYGYVPSKNKKNYEKHGGWTATGAQFQHPYVFKRLFSKEEITFDDMCETKATSKGALYLDMNETLPDTRQFEKELEKVNKEIAQDMAAAYDTFLIPKLTEEDYKITCPKSWKLKKELESEIAKGHNYVFIGRVGQFVPVKQGYDGGLLVREQDGKYYFATGAKGYRWKEAEIIRNTAWNDQIDETYFRYLVDESVGAISVYGDFDNFVSDKEILDITSDELPF